MFAVPCISTTEKGKAYERLVAAVQKTIDPEAKVTWDVVIEGRQVDVQIEAVAGTATLLVLIECRDYTAPIGVEAVEAWAEKKRKLGAHKAIMVASSGYTKGALKAANDADIDACVLKHASDEDWEGYLRSFRTEIRMMVPEYKDVEFESEDGTWRPADLLDRLRDAEGTEDFVDRVLASVKHSYFEAHGEPAPQGRPISALFTFPLPTLATISAPDVVVRRVRFRYEDVEGMKRIIEYTTPEDWVFFKVTAQAVIPEKVFFSFEDLKQLADSFRQGTRQ